jgi:hypothetical protein
MADFPGSALVPLADDRSSLCISTFSGWSLGPGVAAAAAASSAWPAANRALFVPFRVPVPVTVYKMAVGAGATAAGNFDVGIYDSIGNRLVSIGATAKGASVEHILNITDTLLLPGLYYMGMAADGTNNYIGISLGQLAFAKLLGMRQMASAYTLPSTATYATMTTGYVPSISCYLRSE